MTFSALKSSAGTYKVGDGGYNFKDLVGTSVPDGNWSDDDAGAAVSEIIAQYTSHQFVLKMNDDDCDWRYIFADGEQTSGTIEFYMCSIDNSVFDSMTTGGFTIRDNITDCFGMRFKNNKFEVLDNDGGGADWNAIAAGPTTETNKWYHISIRWESTAGAYQGLAEDDFKVFIDGTEYGDYNFANAGDPDRIRLMGLDDCIIRFDAFGFDWDGTYSIGDNKTLEVDTTITSSVSKCLISFPKEGYPEADMQIESDEALTLGTTIQIKDNYTSNGVTNDNTLIFDGEVISKDGNYPPTYHLRSSAKEMDTTRQYTSATYTKDTDGLIAQIISDGDVDYITNGSLTDGADLGTISLEGDKTFRRILDDCARIDGYTWYLHPDGSLYYNTGAVDTGVDIDGSDNTGLVLSAFDMDEHVNRVEILGGFKSDGTPAKGSAEDTTSQGVYGIVKFRDTDAMLNTDALCNTKAAAILAKAEYPPQTVIIRYLDTSKGFLQSGETLSLAWDFEVLDEIIEDEYIIDDNIYNAITGESMLTVSSGLMFHEKKDLLIIQENSQMIQQNATSIISYLMIGTANAQHYSLPINYFWNASAAEAVPWVRNIGATDYAIDYIVVLPHSIGSLSLYLKSFKIGIAISDATDYVTRIRVMLMTDEDSISTPVDLDHDVLNGTAKGTFEYDSGDDGDFPIDLSGSKSCIIHVDVKATTASEIQIAFVQANLYYDT
ncbi:hypothetical protein [Pseudoalteromonas sp.]|uniref:hypothetical protein n=1 Tax=Pseudoalteromonas sp. TaxID=53249 RepID=UPI00260E1465|nr:hypothetical protein [Pseudoalteromonas sp.]MCP4585300.1 hypothetical protein [Pseudoalteromonas sp.]